MKVHINTTPNLVKHPSIKIQIEKQEREKFEKELPKILERMGKMSALLTSDVGCYSSLLDEAIRCYELGLDYATISLIGVSAERFAIELSNSLNFRVNEAKISENEIFNGGIRRQELRLTLLKKSNLITPKIYDNLIKINTIRNKYVHPKKVGNLGEDSLNILNLFIDVLNLRFSDNYEINEGKIFKKEH